VLSPLCVLHRDRPTCCGKSALGGIRSRRSLLKENRWDRNEESKEKGRSNNLSFSGEIGSPGGRKKNVREGRKERKGGPSDRKGGLGRGDHTRKMPLKMTA